MPRYSLTSVLLATLSIAAPAAAQPSAEGEWHHYGGDLASSKYSPLADIDASNFARLEVAWRWRSVDALLSREVAGGSWTGPSSVLFEELDAADPDLWRGGLAPRLSSLKATPLAIDGTLFLATPLYQGAAIDAVTGETEWVFDPRAYESGTPTMSLLWNHRGVATWSDGERDRRIYWGTGDGWLVAVDAATGRPVLGFGDNGRVDLTAGIRGAARSERDYLNALPYSSSSPPLVVGDVIVTGSSIADRRITKEAAPGDVRGWDARTGALRWTFHTIPQAGEPGNETWEEESWRYSGNTNVWTMMSADPELGLVYLPIGTPTNDFYGGHRPGDNLYAESVVAVRAETGEVVWHFQAVHHGVWDYDFPAAPNLVDVEIDGATVPLLAQVSKQGFTYVFHRATGEPIWPIEERPVAASDIPGEKLSATQPFPTRPPPFESQGISEDDLIDFTPQLRQAALEIAAEYRLGPLFTPPILETPGGKRATLQRPGIGGGANWWGAGVDPRAGVLFVPSRNSLSGVEFYSPDPDEGGTVRYTHRSAGGPRGPAGLPLLKPPYSRMTAIDLARGEILWTVPTGNGDHIRNHEALAGLELGPLGGDGVTGPLVTSTLLVQGEAPGGRASGRGALVARDKATGAVVGEVELPARPIGTPMTYRVDGRQYVAITVAGSPPELVALTLPPDR